jgi:hypothetical protein
MHTSGPLFDGRADHIIERAMTEIRQKVSDKGKSLASSALGSSIRAPRTGRSVRSVTTTDHSTTYQTGKYSMPVVVDINETIVTTSLASYGPWLEGTGSRNETTRFPGYFSFRIASQELDGQAAEIADDAIQTYIRELNS